MEYSYFFFESDSIYDAECCESMRQRYSCELQYLFTVCVHKWAKDLKKVRSSKNCQKKNLIPPFFFERQSALFLAYSPLCVIMRR